MTALHLREAGSGPAIVFLHGWTCHGGFFGELMAALAGGFHVFAPDLPGHGRSASAALRLTIGAAADATLDLLARRGIAEVTLVGWSMGAHVAYAMIERDPGRIGGLIVVDMTPKVLNDAGWHLGLRSGLDADRSARLTGTMREAWQDYVPHIVDNMFAPGGGPACRDRAATEIAKNDGRLMAAMWTSLTAQDFRPLLPRIAVPTLIAHGGQSRIYDAGVARYQAGAIAGSRIERFERSGHSPHLEEPEKFTEMVSAFCRRP